MANTSAKKTAAANEKKIREFQYGGLIAAALAILFRLVLRRTGTTGLLLSLSTAAAAFFVTQFLIKSGTPRRDASGELISPGDDLNAGGVTEWATDVVYISWFCLAGSALLGEWVWYLYLIIPVFAAYKLWGFVGPMLGLAGIRLPGMGGGANDADGEEQQPQGTTSKRQEKLKKRLERGDPRVKQVERKVYQ